MKEKEPVERGRDDNRQVIFLLMAMRVFGSFGLCLSLCNARELGSSVTKIRASKKSKRLWPSNLLVISVTFGSLFNRSSGTTRAKEKQRLKEDSQR